MMFFPRSSAQARRLPKIAALLVLLALVLPGGAWAATIVWLDDLPVASGDVVDHPVLGSIQFTAGLAPTGSFSASGVANSLGGFDWALPIPYIGYDASTTGTNAPIQTTVVLTFLGGPIDTSVTPLFVSTNGLAAASSYRIDGAPSFLGAIGSLEGPGIYTTPGAGATLVVSGAGFNHDPDLIQLLAPTVSSITIEIDTVLGDGAGFALGAVGVPEPGAGALLGASLLGLAALRQRS